MEVLIMRYFNQETAESARCDISLIRRASQDYDMMFIYDYDSMFYWIDRALSNDVYTKTEEKAVDDHIERFFNEAIPRLKNRMGESFTSTQTLVNQLKKIFEDSIITDETARRNEIPESDASIKARALLKQLEALA